MNEMLKIFFSLSVSGSLIALFLFALKPFIKNKFSKTWQYYVWLIVLIRLLLPFSVETNIVGQLFSETDKIISTQNEVLEPINDIPIAIDNFVPQSPPLNHNEILQPPMPQEKATNYWREIKGISWLIWLGIAIMLLVRKITSYHSFVRYIKAGISEVSDNKVLEIFKTSCMAAGFKKPLKIYTNPLATSAMLVGLYKPFIVVPDIEVGEANLHHIFAHELTHYKRLDIFYKWLTQVALCLHWYNPLVYLVSREINKNCELSCDEAIIRKLDDKGKRSYGDTLLSSLKLNGNYNDTIIAITLNEDAKLFKERLEAIMKFNRKSKLTIAFSITLTIMMISGAAVTGAYAATTNIPTSIDKPEILITNTTPIMLNSENYTYLTEIKKEQLKSERVMFEIESSKAFLYLEIEDYSEAIGLKVFYGNTNNLVFSSLEATFAEGGVPGFLIDRGKGLYSVELIRSKENTSHNVIVYGVSIEGFTDYENIILPKDKVLNETKENTSIYRPEEARGITGNTDQFLSDAWITYEGQNASNIILEFPDWYTKDMWDIQFIWGDYAAIPIEYDKLDDNKSVMLGVGHDTHYELIIGLPNKETLVIDLRELERNLKSNQSYASNGNNGNNYTPEEADKRGIAIINSSGTWGSEVDLLIPYMTQDGVEKMVSIYLDRQLFPGITPPEGARSVAARLETALKYMSEESRKVVENRITAYYEDKKVPILPLNIPEHFTSGGLANTTQNSNTYTYEGIVQANKYQFGNPFPANKGKQLTFKLNSMEYVSGEVMDEDESILRVLFGANDSGNYNTGFDFKLNNPRGIGLHMPAYKTANYPIIILNYSDKEVKYSFTVTIN